MKVFHFQTRIGVASSTNIEPLVTRFTRDMRLKMEQMLSVEEAVQTVFSELKKSTFTLFL